MSKWYSLQPSEDVVFKLIMYRSYFNINIQYHLFFCKNNEPTIYPKTPYCPRVYICRFSDFNGLVREVFETFDWNCFYSDRNFIWDEKYHTFPSHVTLPKDLGNHRWNSSKMQIFGDFRAQKQADDDSQISKKWWGTEELPSLYQVSAINQSFKH